MPALHVDVKEMENAYVLYTDVPGVLKSDLNLDIKERVLTISYERSYTKTSELPSVSSTTTATDAPVEEEKWESIDTEAEGVPKAQKPVEHVPDKAELSTQQSETNNKEMWRRRERFQGSVTRSLTLPKDANAEGIEAVLENGVLTISIPKVSEPIPETTRITIK
jgi:HSP20 family protein